MPSIEQAVASHYAGAALERTILEALQTLGRDPGALTEGDLAAVGEFHMGGRALTSAIAGRLEPARGTHVVDIGCGIGGTARFLAEAHGCRVTGVDLSPDYVAVARRLTALVGLTERVAFEVGSAVALPLPDGACAAATLLHVGMNLPDKAAAWREAARVLAPGGRFAVYDVMRVGPGEPDYPTAWAAGGETSFLASPEAYEDGLRAAGFRIEARHDHRAAAMESFRQLAARMAAGRPPPLGLHLVMGGDAPAKVGNMLAALEAGRIAPIELQCRRA